MQQILKSITFSVLIHNHAYIALAVGLVLYLVCLFLFFRHKKPVQKFYLAILFLYLSVIASLTFTIMPLDTWHSSAKATAQIIGKIEWIPFVSSANMLKNSIRTGNYGAFIRIIVGNFVVLMPLGVFLPLINPKFRLGRMTVVSILVPVGIEGIQLIGNILMGSAVRYVQVEDVILNGTGCLLAYVVCAGVRSRFRPKTKAKKSTRKAT
jgi:glycopeptide antibiotics resistance protein